MTCPILVSATRFWSSNRFCFSNRFYLSNVAEPSGDRRLPLFRSGNRIKIGHGGLQFSLTESMAEVAERLIQLTTRLVDPE